MWMMSEQPQEATKKYVDNPRMSAFLEQFQSILTKYSNTHLAAVPSVQAAKLLHGVLSKVLCKETDLQDTQHLQQLQLQQLQQEQVGTGTCMKMERVTGKNSSSPALLLPKLS